MKKFLRGLMVLFILVETIGAAGTLAEEEEFKNKMGPEEEANIKVIEYYV